MCGFTRFQRRYVSRFLFSELSIFVRLQHRPCFDSVTSIDWSLTASQFLGLNHSYVKRQSRSHRDFRTSGVQGLLWDKAFKEHRSASARTYFRQKRLNMDISDMVNENNTEYVPVRTKNIAAGSRSERVKRIHTSDQWSTTSQEPRCVSHLPSIDTTAMSSHASPLSANAKGQHQPFSLPPINDLVNSSDKRFHANGHGGMTPDDPGLSTRTE